MGFPLIGEPLALDLVNTRGNTPEGPVEHLGTVAALESWLRVQADRLPAPDAPLTEADLAAVLALREAAATAIDRVRHGTPPPAPVLAALSAAERAAPPYRELAWDGTRLTAVRTRQGSYAQRLTAELAAAVIDLLSGPSAGAVRQCEGPSCRMLFLPAHPRRRWCSPDLCGNRVRVARYYRRHRA